MAIPRQTLVVTRAATTGKRVKGTWVPGSPSTLNIKASVQPLNANEVAALPEGRRSVGSMKLYTSTQLIGVDPATKQNPDIVTIDGFDYEVFQTKPWQNLGSLNHYAAIVTIKQDQS